VRKGRKTARVLVKCLVPAEVAAPHNAASHLSSFLREGGREEGWKQQAMEE